MSRKIPVILIVLPLLFCLYLATYSSAPTSDGNTWMQNIEAGNLKEITQPYHLLPLFVVLLIKKIVSLFFVISPLVITQVWNAILSCLSVFIFYLISRKMNHEVWISVLGSILFGTSFSLWYFANGEMHHPGALLLLIIFFSLIQFRENPSAKNAVFIGFIHAITMAFHQEHMLFVIPIGYIMLSNNKKGMKHFLIYGFSAAFFVTAIYGIIGFFLHDIRHISEFADWILKVRYKNMPTQHLMWVRKDWPILRLTKGSFTSIVFGFQILTDAIRGKAGEFDISYKVVILMSGIVSALLSIFLLGGVFNSFKSKKIDAEVWTICSGLFVWLLIYKFCFNYWALPESPEYHLASTAPIILLATHFLNGINRGRVVLCALALSVFFINLFAGILPWKSYGNMLSDFSLFGASHFTKTDVFISTESVLDPIVEEKWQRFSLKNLFLTHSKQEAFKELDATIQQKLKEGKRVFVYNSTPDAYALDGILHYNHNAQFSREDFLVEWQSIEKKYHPVPIYHYWEGNSASYYQISHGPNEVVWEIK